MAEAGVLASKYAIPKASGAHNKLQSERACNDRPPETKRDWGEAIRMDDAVIERVNEMWQDLGLPGSGKSIWK